MGGLPVSVGDVLTVAEPEYFYGRGELTLRLTWIGGEQTWDGHRFAQVQGMQLREDGGEVRPRTVLIRVSALRAARARAQRQDRQHKSPSARC